MFLFDGSLFDIALANLAVVVGGMLDRPSLTTDCHVLGDLLCEATRGNRLEFKRC
jgi:hypothetical protein